jgi:L-alanine-DL-glutamate epimerase-like enolase superfamily enzyme
VKIERLETFIVNVPYLHDEISSRIRRSGVTSVVVRLTADNGLVGWGESCGNIADAASIECAVKYADPFVVGQNPWQQEAIARDFYKRGTWDRRIQSANFAFAGIDQALWDLCGKEAGQPLYRLFGGSMRESVDYFYYLERGSAEDVKGQAEAAVHRGYTSFYLKVGLDADAELEMLTALRDAIGPEGRIRIDVNEAWTLNQAVRLLNDWDRKVTIDFCEAPVPHDLPEGLAEIRARVPCAISANEALAREVDVIRLIRSRAADVLCFSPFWVGSLRRFTRLSYLAHLDGIGVCKHTHGELGIAAAAAQHALLTIPNAVVGNQQTAAMLADDILAEDIPIRKGAKWGVIDRPGLGVEVDEEKLAIFQEAYRREGQFLPFRIGS